MSTHDRSTRATRSRRRTGVAVATPLVLLATFGLAACGSSSSGSSATTTGGSSSTAATTGASSGGGSTAGATAAAQAAEQVPAHIAETTPLTSRPSKETIVDLVCENQACSDQATGAKAAAAALGWDFKSLDYQSADPSTLLSAMRTALQYHPVAVGFSGIPEAEWSTEIPAYQAAGVAIIPTVTTATLSSTVPVEIGSFTDSGKAMGSYFVSDSGGKGGALLVTLPAFPVLTQYADGVKAAVAQYCPGCTTQTFDGTFAQLDGGQFVPAVVTELKEDPSLHYVIASADLLTPTLPAALQAAGLDDIKILGGQPDPSDIANITSGTETAATNLNNVLIGWEIVDAAARVSEHMAIAPDDGGVPFQLLTKANLTSGSDLNSYAVPSDYQAQYEALWHVG